MKSIDQLLLANRAWASDVKERDPDFFTHLAYQQNPDYLWIGCSDSRVPANQIVDLPPGEVFVHRNIANVVVHTDLNCLSVIQYSVEVLKVKHIIVCGHYGCGGIKAAVEPPEHGLIDNWLRHIRDVQRLHADELDGLENDALCDRLCELNVIEQVRNVAHSTVVQGVWRSGAPLSIHGWVYSVKNGVIKDLKTTIDSLDDL